MVCHNVFVLMIIDYFFVFLCYIACLWVCRPYELIHSFDSANIGIFLLSQRKKDFFFEKFAE